MKNNLNRAEVNQVALRSIENRDRFLVEKNFERINFWSLIAVFVMILVGLAQVYTIRTLFIDESMLGKVLRGKNR